MQAGHLAAQLSTKKKCDLFFKTFLSQFVAGMKMPSVKKR